jgi:hypothetical protein
MNCKGLRALLVALVLLTPVSASAQWTAVPSQQDQFNATLDGSIDFPSPTTVGNHVLILVTIGASDEAVTITNTTMSFTTFGPYDSVPEALRHYFFCAPADGDDSFTVNTATNTTQSLGMEFSGGTCGVAAEVSRNDTSGAAHELDADLYVPINGSLIVSLIRSTTAASFTKDGAFTYFAGGAVTNAGAAYRVVTAGTYDTPWTSGGETAYILAMAFAPAGAGAGGLTTLGVGQ